jgi:E3 ubiquitin-protein ligase HUWE1
LTIGNFITFKNRRNNTEYSNYSPSSPQIQWFWRAVRSFSQEERAKLIQFVTGTSKVPLEGFARLQGSSGVQKFQIHKDFGDVNRLPSAHTW